MSNAMKFNIIQVITWSIAAICLIIIFVSGDTIEAWGDNKNKTLLLSIIFLIGFGTDFVLRVLEKSKKWNFKRVERDIAIQYQSQSIGFVLVLIYVFILSISLYVYYEESGFIPVGWVWFIAYSTIVFANLSSGYSSLLLYLKQGSY
ncbi:hypothetical protein [Acidaminobacter hydrogenoformans]|uniref:Uncharacterized protein n=1 Tax=Acidaminobacter hydrogenoformans DSM 2784 TaxID=1120920 RepID=A0A1G5S6I5_9FIRM|nr:hypothetical protein [Acidaminobacter hydrogenoformans]SCZ81828.1 hypothetical protein SAMN03080599_03073 [Acidaminobacter hydrogenoformans DSM 2784]